MDETTKTQSSQIDDKFYERADAHISLANSQITQSQHPGMVSNSFLYAAARFNAWLAAVGYESGDEMKKHKEEIMDFFTKQYRAMLEENVETYIKNFEQYLGKR